MEQINADAAADKLANGQATITTHPEAPGVLFLRNPSGSESIVERPTKELTPAQKATFAMKAFNAFKPASIDETESPLYNLRTNYAGGLLRDMGAIPEPKLGTPTIGEVRKGYRFKGGNPAMRENWEKVQ